jgi:hypothetical protein
MVATLVSAEGEALDLGSLGPGEVQFIEIPQLPIGVQRLVLTAKGSGGHEGAVGELELVVREPRPWTAGTSPQGAFIVDVDPPTATLEQLWEGKVDIQVHGPAGRVVVCTLYMSARDAQRAQVCKKLPSLRMPVPPSVWRGQFDRHFRRAPDVQNAYDDARICRVEFNAEELGAFEFTCERETLSLRWVVRRDGHRQTVRLLDDGGEDTTIQAARWPFETPDASERLDPSLFSGRFEASASGGMYVAIRGEFTAAVIVPPVVRGLAELRCNPQIRDRQRSPDKASRAIGLITLWSSARITGDLLSSSRQRDVLLALARHLFFVLGGDAWERAEVIMAAGDRGLHELKRAVFTKRWEAGLSAALMLEYPTLALATNDARVARLTSLARSFLALPRPPATATRSPGVKRSALSDSDWLCEFALRLASDPGGTASWAGDSMEVGLRRLSEMPTLARAARFLVLTVDRHQQNQGPVEGLYAGWDWT